MLLRVGGANLNQALLMSAGKPNAMVAYAMPSERCDFLEKNRFLVNRLQYFCIMCLICLSSIFFWASATFGAKHRGIYNNIFSDG
jgi:hypothetical protein